MKTETCDGLTDLENLRQRLEQAEEALRAIVAGEVDSLRPPDGPDHRLLGEARATLDEISARYQQVAEQRSAILDALPAQMAILGPDGTILAANRAWRRLADSRGLGHPDQGVGLNYLEICARCDPDEAPEAHLAEKGLREVIAGRRPSFTLEYPCHSPTSRRWYRLLASPLPVHRGAVILHLDITELKLAEEAQVESERRWRQLVETLPDALFLVDGGLVELANEAAAKMLGLSVLPHLIGRRWVDLVHPGDREEGLALVAEEGVEGRSNPVGLRLLREGGQAVDVEMSTGVVPRRQGSAVLLIARDVTRRKRSEQELQKLNAQFLQAQKLDAVGRLAGGVAHDFNNLLTAINGFSDLLLARLEGGAPRVYAEEIRRAGERAAILTRQLLTFGRRTPGQPKLFTLDERLSDLARLLRRTIGEDIHLEMALEAAAVTIWADPDQVDQAVLNLVVNARDAMRGGGTLQIRTWTEHRPTGADPGGRCHHPPNTVALAVADSGCGMEPDVLPHIFEPFFTTKDRESGTGLGLAMVYAVVQQAGGQVEVDSTVGKGTELRLYWPLASGHESDDPPRDPIVADPPAEVGSATILLVEDERAVLDLVEEVLRSRGHRLLVARDGPAAESLARRCGHLDLLLTDVILPGMNGREVAERVVALHPGLAVLFMTGYSREELSVRTCSHRGLDVLNKPFTPQQLLQRVGEALLRARPPYRQDVSRPPPALQEGT